MDKDRMKCLVQDSQAVSVRFPRIMIAAEKSGGGKTLFTCALLSLLKERVKIPCSGSDESGDAGNLFYGDAGGLQFLIYIMYRGVEACIALCHDSHFLAGVMQGKGGGIHLVVGVEGIGPLLAHGQGEAADTVGGYVEPEHDVGGA